MLAAAEPQVGCARSFKQRTLPSAHARVVCGVLDSQGSKASASAKRASGPLTSSQTLPVHNLGLALLDGPQRYIHNPMLLDGRKFDLRLYVLVTSLEPLRVWLFKEGLVRLSTKKYTLRNLKSRFTHLTNYSINRRSGSFQVGSFVYGESTARLPEQSWVAPELLISM